MGSNKIHRSLNQGDDWETLSGDLTRGGLKGNVPFGTLTCIDEHPSAFGQLVVGSDDGLVHVTMDGGHSWPQVAHSHASSRSRMSTIEQTGQDGSRTPS